MTMQAQELIGARVTDADGQVVGTVSQVFNDDAQGTPAWVRVHAGKQDRFVPLSGSRMTANGLSVPFEAQRIISGPDVAADQHMSAAQTHELNRYYGLTVPPQGGQPDTSTQPGNARTSPDEGARPDTGTQPGNAVTRPDFGPQPDEDWLIRAEERLDVGTEVRESGRARLHKYVDVEPVEQPVHVSHEEIEVERVPITPEERVNGVIAEGVQEIILHEERAVLRKETVPVERVRLVTKKVEEDSTIRDEIRKERVEVEAGGSGRTPPAAEPGQDSQRRQLCSGATTTRARDSGLARPGPGRSTPCMVVISGQRPSAGSGAARLLFLPAAPSTHGRVCERQA
jgi:stress response protein YsnF/sporulation protein YlmC with PRC-barrel domain